MIPQHHIYRHKALRYLVMSLQVSYERDKSTSLEDLEEAITYTRELLSVHYTAEHTRRGEWLARMVPLLRMHVDATGCRDHLDEAIRLDEELRNLITMSTARTESSALN